MTDVQQFKDVREYLGNKFNDLQTNGDAVELAMELTYGLGAILLSVPELTDALRKEIYATLSDESLTTLFSPSDEAAH